MARPPWTRGECRGFGWNSRALARDTLLIFLPRPGKYRENRLLLPPLLLGPTVPVADFSPTHRSPCREARRFDRFHLPKVLIAGLPGCVCSSLRDHAFLSIGST